ncbi:MAG TPA: hypothetical protein VJK26_00755 [Patescibacteria group bacterium]|nr:hypothetical protein [Patescibacteria group bacterium]
MNKEKKLPEIPKSLQGILWSVNVARLDLERDKNYIIHQVLAYGNLEQIRWLFQVYGRQGVKDVFMKEPTRVYDQGSFIFVKNIILNLKTASLDKKRYVQSTF